MYTFEDKGLLYDPYDGSILGSKGYKTLSKPDSTKRIKPLDLFSASTDRTVSTTDVSNSAYIRYHSPTRNYLGVLSAGALFSPDFTSAEIEVRAKLLDAIKRQNVNLAQAIMEFRQSVDLFASLAQELYSGWRAVRKGHILKRGFFTQDKQLSKKWIELQFGLVPLVSDLEGICDSLASQLRNGAHVYIKQRGGDSETQTREMPNSEGEGTLFQLQKSSIRLRLDARYTIKESMVDDVARFGFSNPLALGWELVPFSFVVDWLLPVGGWLGRLDALIGIDDLTWIHNRYQEDIYETSSSNGGLARTVVITKSRSQAQKQLNDSFPRYDASFSLRKLMTASSLLHLVGK